MEGLEESPRTHVNNIFRKKCDKTHFEKIYNEYSLKKSIIDPSNKSPNLFINNLEKRMRIYYNALYNSVNL